MSIRTKPDRQQSPFLNKLPAELRNRVYEYVLGDVRVECIWGIDHHMRIGTNKHRKPLIVSVHDTSKQTWQICSGHLKHLSVCRQVHHEARPLFYTLNEFGIDETKDVHVYEEVFKPEYLNLIRHIRLSDDMRASATSDSKIADIPARLPNLVTIYLSVLSDDHFVWEACLKEMVGGISVQQSKCRAVDEMMEHNRAVEELLRTVVPAKCKIIFELDGAMRAMVDEVAALMVKGGAGV